MTRSAFIIGGTGQIGIAAAAAMLDRGWRVTLGHTGRREPRNVPAGASLAVVDRRDTASLEAAIGSGTDVLLDTMAFNGADAAQLLGLAGRYGQLAVISTAGLYEDSEGRSLETAGTKGYPHFEAPRRETDRTVAPDPRSYTGGKVELEHRLLEASTRPVAILRPCAIHGINSPHPREFWFVKRMLDGRTQIPLAGNADAAFHTSATVNIAQVLLTALAQPQNIVLNAADPTAPTLRQIGELLAAQLGWTGQFVSVPADATIGHTPWSVPHDFTVSMDAATALGYRPASPYPEALGPYLAWMKANAADWQKAFPVFANYPNPPFDYTAEDAVLNA